MTAPNKPAMRSRVSYLRMQAESFQNMSDHAAATSLAEQFADLARRCNEIANTIERNLRAGINDWSEPQPPEPKSTK